MLELWLCGGVGVWDGLFVVEFIAEVGLEGVGLVHFVRGR
jgi:hypothetical protein